MFNAMPSAYMEQGVRSVEAARIEQHLNNTEA